MKSKKITDNVKKILFILHLPPPIHGASILNDQVKNCELINSNYHTKHLDLSTAKEISDIGKHGFNKYIKSLSLLIKIIEECRNRRFDLFYLTMSPYGIPFFKDSLVALLLKLYKAPTIIHLHGKGIKDEISYSKIKRWYYRLVFRKTTVIHNSPLLYYDIAEVVKPENCIFVANGTSPIFNEKDNVKNINRTDSTILYLSNMEETKGPMVLLEAANILKNRKLHFKVIFAGQWKSDKTFQNRFNNYISKNNLHNSVEYIGAKYGSDKAELFRYASIFVLPTFYRNECFPVSILEAMSAGLPVISTNEGAIPEIIDENETGFIIQKQNPQDLADRIEVLLKDTNKARLMGYQGFIKYYENYTLNAYCERIYNSINRMINN